VREQATNFSGWYRISSSCRLGAKSWL